MTSGNSWQLYQELGGVPPLVLEALKRLPRRERRRERRGTIESRYSPLSTLAIFEAGAARPRLTPSHSADKFDRKRTDDGGESGRRRRSYSQPRALEERAEELLVAKPYQEGELQTCSSRSRRSEVCGKKEEEAEEEDPFTTASDMSGCRTDEIALVRRKGRNFAQPPERRGQCPVHGRLNSRSGLVVDTRLWSTTRKRGRMATSYPVSVATPAPAPMTAGFLLKLARRRHKAALTAADRDRAEREKRKILWNLLTLSVAFLFLISAFQGLQNLQTTIHGENGLGAISLGAVYLGQVVSCVFTPPYLLDRIGCKLTLILSVSTFSIYMLTHLAPPRWYTLIPSSLLVGFGAAPLWAAKCAYLSETGFRYAELNLESSNAVIVRFFGIFFMIVHLGQVFGNLISSSILLAAAVASEPPRVVDDDVDETCGHYFTDSARRLSPTARANLASPPANAVGSLCAVYFTFTVVAALIIAMFLNQLSRDAASRRQFKPRFSLDIWSTTLRHLRQPRHLLLLPLTVFNGMQQAFVAGEFTKAYVGCGLGVTHVGRVMMSFGLADAVCSLVFGPLIKLFGRMPLLMFGAVVDMLMIFTLAVWPPNPADTVILYAIASCWGMADGVWSTQINGLWVVMFADNLAAAFANYRLWESVGFMIAFFCTPFFSTETKLYVLLAMLYVGMLGYGLIELWEPLEDYAVRLKQKLNRSASLSRHAKRSGEDSSEKRAAERNVH